MIIEHARAFEAGEHGGEGAAVAAEVIGEAGAVKGDPEAVLPRPAPLGGEIGEHLIR